MLQFEFDAFYRADVKHQAADVMSRLPPGRTDMTKLDDNIPVLAKTTNITSTDEIDRT